MPLNSIRSGSDQLMAHFSTFHSNTLLRLHVHDMHLSYGKYQHSVKQNAVFSISVFIQLAHNSVRQWNVGYVHKISRFFSVAQDTYTKLQRQSIKTLSDAPFNTSTDDHKQFTAFCELGHLYWEKCQCSKTNTQRETLQMLFHCFTVHISLIVC
jgi:hypothetical protein